MKAASYKEALEQALTDDDWHRCRPPGFSDCVASEIAEGVWRRILVIAGHRAWPMMLQGDVGTGKTYTAAMMLSVWRACGLPAVWTTWPELRRDIIQARRQKGGVQKHTADGKAFVRTEGFYWKSLANRRTLVAIDDFGIGKADEETLPMLHKVLTEAAGPLIMTSNLTPEEMVEKQCIDHRIADRIKGGAIIEMNGESRRKGRRYRVEV